MDRTSLSELPSCKPGVDELPREQFLATLEESIVPLTRRSSDESGTRPVEAALRGSYRALFDNIPSMCFTLDAAGGILEVNSYGATELGYQPEDLIGQSVLKVCHPEDQEGFRERFRFSLEHPEEVSRCRFRKVRSDDSTLWVQEALRVVEENERTVVLVVCEDVTESVDVEAQLRRYQDQLRALTSELALAEERERRRIAEGLHDQVGQLLAMAKLRLGALDEPGDSAARSHDLADIRGLLQQALTETRSLTFELSCPVLYRLGLEEALRDLSERLSQQTKTLFRFESDSLPKPLAEDAQVTTFRVIQELLFNIVKHAQAQQARLSVSRVDETLRVVVEDDGVGFDDSKLGIGPTPAGGFGLFGSRERLEHLGGRLEITTVRGGGTRMSVTVPLAPETELGPGW